MLLPSAGRGYRPQIQRPLSPHPVGPHRLRLPPSHGPAVALLPVVRPLTPSSFCSAIHAHAHPAPRPQCPQPPPPEAPWWTPPPLSSRTTMPLLTSRRTPPHRYRPPVAHACAGVEEEALRRGGGRATGAGAAGCGLSRPVREPGWRRRPVGGGHRSREEVRPPRSRKPGGVRTAGAGKRPSRDGRGTHRGSVLVAAVAAAGEEAPRQPCGSRLRNWGRGGQAVVDWRSCPRGSREQEPETRRSGGGVAGAERIRRGSAGQGPARWGKPRGLGVLHGPNLSWAKT
ncbi:hypothetical protein U9M48_006128 [Paspalum notatum var. saurae]|uniref:Uncharacterized protein n=1 Tax=Paspalum notatum var. saurae TaxID=547442 RepID=A0AAQ3SJ54_PASNO